MARAFFRVGNEGLFVWGSGVPEDFGDIPGPVGVVDKQAESAGFELLRRTSQCFRGRFLQEGFGLLVNRRTEKVVRGGVADIEPDFRIERGEIDKLGSP